MLLHDILDRQARRSPDRVAVRRGAVAWSYEVLRLRSLGYSRWLRDHGVGRGDRVLVAAPHAPETVALLYAAARIGALYVIVGDAIPPSRLRQIVDDCQPRVVLAQGTSASVAQEAGVPSVAALADLPAGIPDELPTDPTPMSVDPISLIY